MSAIAESDPPVCLLSAKGQIVDDSTCGLYFASVFKRPTFDRILFCGKQKWGVERLALCFMERPKQMLAAGAKAVEGFSVLHNELMLSVQLISAIY